MQYMIRDLKCLYVAINNNKVIHFETNLLQFVESLKVQYSETKSYSYYVKKFKCDNTITLLNDNKEVIFLQKLV